MGGGRITWGGDLGRLSWRWGWWLFSVAMRWRWNPVTAAVLPLCRDTNRCPLPLPVYPFYPFSSFSPTVSLGFPVDIPGFFCVSQFRSFLSLRSWFLSLSFPPFLPFYSPLILPFGSLFIGARGARSTLPRPIATHAWGARLLHCCGAGRGGQWRRR